jgi:predicted ester cyclase
MPTTTALSPQALIDAAKAPILAYNDKNWDRVRATVTPDFLYDEIGTRRNLSGADEAINAWKGWAGAFPDSAATFHGALVSGNTVVLEVSWKGTHLGLLQTPQGPVAGTGKPIEIRACIVSEIAGDKARSQRHYFDMLTLLDQLGLAS